MKSALQALENRVGVIELITWEGAGAGSLGRGRGSSVSNKLCMWCNM